LCIKVPIDIQKLEEYKLYERELKSFVIVHVFYSVDEVLCYEFDAVAAWTK